MVSRCRDAVDAAAWESTRRARELRQFRECRSSQVRLGIIPYYMFIARDTGAQAYFNVPLVRAQKLYSEAIRSTSGLCRTARGPSMSCTPGKVEVVGVQEVQGTEAFVLRFLQCRDDEWIGKVFFAKFDPKAIWCARRVLTCCGAFPALA